MKNFLHGINELKKLCSLSLFFVLFTCLSALSLPSFTQEVPVHISNTSIYSFLEEMAEEQLIRISTVTKPWSRLYIAGKLDELQKVREELNPRQLKELDFYLRDYNKELLPGKNYQKRPDLFYYKDSLFTFSVNPIGGIRYWSNGNGTVHHRWNGAEAFAYIGKWGFYASLRDNHESQPISGKTYITQRMGGNYKGDNDYSEMRGGITYDWKWGTLGLVKDHFIWGNNVHGANIFSGRTPSFAHLDLFLNPVPWFEFHFTEGWLVSEVVDSSRSYWVSGSYGVDYREVYFPKHLSANLFTFKPWQHTSFSFGNSIVFADVGLNPGYLIPFFFFKSVDHTLNAHIDNQNSQMFFDFSTRVIRHTHFYATFFLDEIATTRMFDPDRHSNFFSYKAGAEVSNFPLQNAGIQAEFTRTNPLAFRHYVPTLTFASNRYNLGNYLLDNSREYYLALWFRPVRGLLIRTDYNLAQKGPDYTALGTDRLGLPFMETVEWENREAGIFVRYQIINDGFIFAGFRYRKVSGPPEYTPEIFRGKTSTFSGGINFGF
ncbi:MAG: hypothetical protein GXO83_03840 [Chlorobi bacterium]|nr:hypothetical protein [Chlorobiota bacterium]